jgi:hypothetical protein
VAAALGQVCLSWASSPGIPTRPLFDEGKGSPRLSLSRSPPSIRSGQPRLQTVPSPTPTPLAFVSPKGTLGNLGPRPACPLSPCSEAQGGAGLKHLPWKPEAHG